MSSASILSVRPSREVLDEVRRRDERVALGLYPHQVEGVALLLGRRRAILSDLEDTLSRLSPGLADAEAGADPAWVAEALRQAAVKYKAEHASETAEGGRVSRPPLSAEAIELLAKVLSGPQETRFKVASSKGDRFYSINLVGQDADCSCPGFEYRGTCKHVVQLKTALSKGAPLPSGFEAA